MAMQNSKQKAQNEKSTSKPAGSMAELMARSKTVTTLKKGDIVEGTVKKLTPKEITLDINAKSDALVLEFDRKNVENLLKVLKPGQKVKASVLFPESEGGFPIVSLRKTLDDIMYSTIEGDYKKNASLNVHIVEVTRGGYFAETKEGLKGFLPLSQTMQQDNIFNKNVTVKVIEYDRPRKRLIFSEKAIVYVSDPAEMEKLVKKESITEGEVTNVTPHGIYLSLIFSGGKIIEGFIHISEVSGQRVENLQNMFKRGDKVKAQVIDIDCDSRRVNLSIKRLEKGKFFKIKESYKKDQEVKGTVKEVKSKKIILQIDDKIAGYIPESKIPSGAVYKKGDTVEATVEGFDDKNSSLILAPVLKTKFVGYR